MFCYKAIKMRLVGLEQSDGDAARAVAEAETEDQLNGSANSKSSDDDGALRVMRKMSREIIDS